MFKALRKNKLHKAIASFLLVNFISQILLPLNALALTSGPSQPEVQSFEPVGTNQMVDPFTGDFTYNIPLFNLPGPNGGYPFNMAYHSSGITKETEASWVGLGWNINAGSINRMLRNVPDEFNENDNIRITQGIKPNWTVGVDGALGAELVGGDLLKGTLSLSSSIYYNNYRGVGLSIGASIQGPVFSGDNNTASAGLNIELDSQSGLGVTPSLSLSSKKDLEDCSTNNTKNSISAGYNSMTGLKDLSLGFNRSNSAYNEEGILETKSWGDGFSIVGSSRTFAGSSGSPSIGNAYIGTNISLNLKTGINAVGIFGTLTVGAFYNEQRLINNYNPIDYTAYGYLHMDKSNIDNSSIRDASRIDDGIIYKHSKRLPYPVVDYDVYSLTGQGFASTFRPHKNRTGVITPQYRYSSTGGSRLGPEFGLGLTQNIGGNFGTNSSVSIESGWNDNNTVDDLLAFKGNDTDNNLYESYYFKAYGEHTVRDMDCTNSSAPIDNFLDNNHAGYVNLKQSGNVGSNYNFSIDGKIITKNSNHIINEPTYKGRRPRGTNIRAITVDELINWQAKDGTIKKMIPQYYTEYYRGQKNEGFWNKKAFDKNDLEPFNYRAQNPNHIAIFVGTSPDGKRYVYGQPAYNYSHVEEVHSVSPKAYGTERVNVPSDSEDRKGNEYLSKKEISAYPYSHLLTAVLGADYVDADDVPGPSDGDYGYWVKFNYALMHGEDHGGNYRWSAPYFQGNYVQGLETDTKDDKVVCSYGKKEVWYLATAETATHISEFYTSPRLDAAGALPRDEINNVRSNISNADHIPLYKLDSISLFSKNERYTNDGIKNSDAIPIQTAHLEYDYLLCKGTPNTSTTNSAGEKLTLQQVFFTYKGNERGKLSPYEFHYNNESDDEDANYNSKVDKWGNYRPDIYWKKPADLKEANPLETPYLNQYLDDSIHNKNASTWLLNKIELPSGGDINIEYEADRYAYVQDQVAMQMTPIIGLGTAINNSVFLGKLNGDNGDDRRVYFELEYPTDSDDDLEKYISVGEELYFKTRVQVRNTKYETISGYAMVGAIKFDENSINESGLYTQAYIVLNTPHINGKDTKRHPFAVTAWNYLRVNNPDYIYNYGRNFNTSNARYLGFEEFRAKASALLSMRQTIAQTFKGFYSFMADKNWANEIDLNNSFIRLRTPDKEKFGGGSRVKKLTMTDNWITATNNQEASSTYGTVYDYTMEENGEIISSGVAEYEPLIGGDEIALRKPLRYHHRIIMKTNLGLYDEDPINEALYPGASVGYRKVSAMSLASYYASLKEGDKDYEKNISLVNQYKNSRSKTGKTVYDFYTAKEFPVQKEATELYDSGNQDCTMCEYKSFVPVPFIGMFSKNVLAATQGYSIVLNDMHGKQKKITQFAQDNEGNFITDFPVSSVEYVYNRKDNKNNTGALESNVTVMFSDTDPDDNTKAKTAIKPLGEERDFWVDMRKSYTKGYSGGVDVNTEIFYFFLGLYFWPSYSRYTSEVKTVVTNKVVHQSGILIKTKVQNGESVVVSENKYFDPLTGEPLLTSVTNDFDAPMYTYQMPARWDYEGMRGVYETSGAEINATLKYYSTSNGIIRMRFNNLTNGSLNVLEKLTSGAIVILKGENLQLEYEKRDKNEAVFTLEEALSGDITTQYGNGRILTLKVIKPGKTNQLDAKDNHMQTLDFDPTINRSIIESEVTKVIPHGFVDFLNRALQDGPDGQFESGRRYYFKETDTECDVLNSSVDKTCFTEFPELVTVFPNGLIIGNVGDPHCNGLETEYNCVVQKYCNEYRSFLWHFGAIGRSSGPVIHTGIRWFYDNADESESTRNYHFIKGFKQISPTQFKVLYEPNGNDCPGQDPQEEIICLDEDDNFNGEGAYTNYAISVNAKDKIIPDDGIGVSPVLQASHSDFVKQDNGNWLPFKNYVYNETRAQKKPLVALSSDGTFLDDFYFYNRFSYSTSNKWQYTSETTMFNKHSKIVEEKDVIGNYSTVLYGFNEQFVVATGSNLKNDEIYTNNFEELNNNLPQYSTSENHSGRYSLKFDYDLLQSFFLIPMSAQPEKEYFISLWLKIPSESEHIHSSINEFGKYPIYVNNSFNDFPSTRTYLKVVGKPINGWQKMEATFSNMFSHKTLAPIRLYVTQNGYPEIFIDDIRVHHTKGNVKTYVYNPSDWSLSATLDENNYAIFYYYDEKGELFQVKRETERGIQTVKEVRKHIQEKQ